MVVSVGEVQAFVLACCLDSLTAKGLAPRDVPDDFDLLAEGVIDSLGILEMVLALEQQFGLEIDFDDLAPDDLTRVGPLSIYVAAQSRDGHHAA